MKEDAGNKKWHGEQNGRNAQRVTNAVHRMPMTGSILRDPLFVSASAQHVGDDITINSGKFSSGKFGRHRDSLALERAMAKVIEFHIPATYRKPWEKIVRRRLGNVIEFCPLTRKSA